MREAALAACHLLQDLPLLSDAAPSEIVARLEDVPPLGLYAAYLAAPAETEREVLRTYVTRWQHVAPTITGHDLRARGLPPGPQYKRLLTALRNAWLDGEINTPEEEAQLLEKLLR